MKCEQAQKLILKEDTGELARWQRPAMERHVERCSDCRHFRFDLHQIAETTVIMKQPAVNRLALQRLLNEARRIQAQRAVPNFGRTLREFFQPLGMPSLALRVTAMATAVILLVSGGLVCWLARDAAQQVAWDDGVDQQLAHLQDTLATLEAEAAHAGDIEAIARQLLAAEG
jgi:hypothetical protein